MTSNDLARNSVSLLDYFDLRDGDDPPSALNLLSDDVGYHLMPAPGTEISGTGRERLRSTLARVSGRPGLHRIVANATSGRVQFVVGHRVQGAEVVGSFLAVATTNETGELAEYLGAYFDSTVLLGGLSPSGEVS